MNTPEWLVPGTAGAVLGGVDVAVALFTAVGWMTGSRSDRMAQDITTERVMAVMVPVCVERARRPRARRPSGDHPPGSRHESVRRGDGDGLGEDARKSGHRPRTGAGMLRRP